MSGNIWIPSDTEVGKLEETILKVFEKLDVDPKNIEDCHWLKTRNSSKEVIIKLSRRKDAFKIRQVKKILKSLNLESVGKSFLLTIVCVSTIKSSGPNVKSCGIINIYLAFGFRTV